MALVQPTPSALAEAAQILRSGGVVAFPTETVYGLAADARNAKAVASVFRIKGRPADHPVIVHIPHRDHASNWWREVPQSALLLAENFWPGPVTLIANRQVDVLDEVTGGRDTVALRVPSHPVALQLLNAFGGGLVGPSANRFGEVSPTLASDVFADLEDQLDMIIDGGPCDVGIESTVVDCSTSARILRPGAITANQVSKVLGYVVDDQFVSVDSGAKAPGLLANHYQPAARVIIVETVDDVLRLMTSAERVGLIDSSGLLATELSGQNLQVLGEGAQSNERLAHDLYRLLRMADELELEVVAVVLPSAEGIGVAIVDRLRRASSNG